MDHTPTFGWYYISGNQKSPSWSGVPYFYNFLTRKDSRPGPLARKPDWVNWSRGILSNSALPAASLPMILSWWRSGQPAFPRHHSGGRPQPGRRLPAVEHLPISSPAGHPYSGGPPQISDRPPNWFWEVYRFKRSMGRPFSSKVFFQQGIHQKCGDTQKYHLSADQPQYKGGGTLPEHNHKHCGQDAEKESDAQPELRDVPVAKAQVSSVLLERAVR